MRISVLLLWVCLLFLSCASKKENNNTIAKESIKKDSATTVKPEKSVNPYTQVDVSPMDICYYPVDYPKLKISKAVTTPPLARVVYSRPHLQGRKLFHDVLKYGEPWRLGANEATELDLYADASIQGKKIKAGRYILYCIPGQNEWTIVLNSNIDSWGLQQDASKDIFRFIVPVRQTNSSLEFFTMLFQQTPAGADLLMAWDNVEAKLPLTF